MVNIEKFRKRFKTSSHTLKVETSRWHNLKQFLIMKENVTFL
jgi:hypothetical protein